MTMGRWSAVLVGLVLGIPHFGLGEQPAADNELVALEKEWQAAYQRKDATWISAALAEDYMVTYGDGSVGDKASELRALRDGEETISASASDQFRIVSRGPFAIVNYRLRVQGTRKGKPLDAQFRFTDVFERRSGRWICIASHNTHIGEPLL
jgi:ketosteroid isomerase-like protein